MASSSGRGKILVIHLAPKSRLTPELLEAVRYHKPAMRAHLRTEKSVAPISRIHSDPKRLEHVIELISISPMNQMLSTMAPQQTRMQESSGRCCHCLNYCDRLSWDHVLPQSWYPDSTPRNVERWQMPACLKCNQKYGRIETELLLRLALGLDPTAEAAKGVVERVHRSFDPAKARNSSDQEARLRRRAGIATRVMPRAIVRPENVMPGLGHHPTRPSKT